MDICCASQCMANLPTLMWFFICFCLSFWKWETTVKSTRSEDGLGNEDFIKYDLLTLMNATGEFSVDNKVGEGGFGVVYKVIHLVFRLLSLVL